MNPPPSEFAWLVHAAQESWTAKADAKASIMLAFQSGLTVAVVSLNRGTFTAAWQRPFAIGGVALLVLGALAACAVIAPWLGPTRHRTRDEDLVYFGQLRRWRPDALARRLTRLTPPDETAMVARRLVMLSRLNWRKHRCLQLSVGLSMIAVVALAVGGTLAPSA